MILFDRRTASVITTLLLFAAVGAFIYGARKILIVFLFAIFFAYLLEPIVGLVQRRSVVSKGKRGRAILQVYALLVILVVVFVVLVGPRLADEARKLSATLPEQLNKVTSGQIAMQIGSKRGWSAETQQRAQQFLASHRAEVVAWGTELGKRGAELATNAVWIILIPILAIFFLKDGPQITNSVVEVFNRGNQRQFLRDVFSDLDRVLAGYIRAQLALAALSLVAYTVVLEIMQVPYPIVLGVMAGIMEFIPVVGPLVAAITILGVAFLSNYPHLLIVALFLGAWRLMQDYVNAPRIMAGSLELHPLTAIFAVLVGGEIAGVLGVFLSIPIVAALRILWRRWEAFSGEATITGVGVGD